MGYVFQINSISVIY